MGQGSTRRTGVVPSVLLMANCVPFRYRMHAAEGAAKVAAIGLYCECCYLLRRRWDGPVQGLAARGHRALSFACTDQYKRHSRHINRGDLVDSKRAVQMQLRRSQGRVGPWCR